LTDIRRGDIWLVDLGDPVGHEQAGRRPAVVISNDMQNAGRSGVVAIVPLTTRARGLPSHIEVDPDASGLKEVSYATCEHMRSISVDRTIARLGTVPPESMFAIGNAVRILLDL
jgi:mRNA interferase MazF